MSRAFITPAPPEAFDDPRDAEGPCANPICPRCGYDLSGPIPGWLDACPLSGTCPECGEAFTYGNVFHPERLDVPRFIEHVRSRPGDGLLRRNITFFGSAWSTWVWALAPWYFFRRILITHRIVPGRWLVWCLLLALPLHAAASALSMFRVYWLGPSRLALSTRDDWMAFASSWTYPVFAIQSPAPSSIWPIGIEWEILRTPTWVFMALAMHAGYALTMLALPTTLSRAKLRTGHVVRAFIFGLSWCLLLIVFRLCRNAYVALEILSMPAGPRAVSGALGTAPVMTFARGGFRAIPRPYFLDDLNAHFMLVATLSFVAAWWLCAMVIGWKLERGKLVFVLLTIIALLAAACVDAWRS